MNSILTAEQLDALRHLDGCVLADAIETFHERLRDEGFADNSLRCLFPQFPPMLGYAATIKVRGSAPPMATGYYSDRTDWWDYILSLPSPRVLVVEDMATRVAFGSLLGSVHINIVRALGCVGAVTNGAVRELPAAEQASFPLFARGVSVSHSYIHVIEFGTPVEIGGTTIKSGDLLHGDLHGVQTIPLTIAGKIPLAAAEIIARKKELITLCQSQDFSLEKLRAAVTKLHPLI
jgi:regulator of RNase E activity RraA